MEKIQKIQSLEKRLNTLLKISKENLISSLQNESAFSEIEEIKKFKSESRILAHTLNAVYQIINKHHTFQSFLDLIKNKSKEIKNKVNCFYLLGVCEKQVPELIEIIRDLLEILIENKHLYIKDIYDEDKLRQCTKSEGVKIFKEIKNSFKVETKLKGEDIQKFIKKEFGDLKSRYPLILEKINSKNYLNNLDIWQEGSSDEIKKKAF